MLHQTAATTTAGAAADTLFIFSNSFAPRIKPTTLSFLSMDCTNKQTHLLTSTSSSSSLKCVSRDSHETQPRKDDVPIHGVSELVVGVLGGGQLGRMLCQAASQMAIKVMILDPLENCPASSLSYNHMVGSFDDSATHVDVETMEMLEQIGVDCQPKASTIRIIQIDDLEGAKRSGDLFGYPLMIKSKRLAYDGRGNAVAHSEEELSSAVAALGGFDRGLYVRSDPLSWLSLWQEEETILLLCYPVVETIHKENICHIVKAPANVTSDIRKRAADVAYKAVSSLEGAGVFAVELFLTGDGQILLNEVAPRPHNSGHHTIESCYTSQYEQHLRAVVGLPLGDPSMKTPAAVMYNILGEDEGEPGFFLAHQLIKRALSISGASVHWYDKPEMRKQRKMGHVTIVGPSMGAVEERLKSMLKEEGFDCQSAVTPRVGIIMGSDSDLPVMKDAARILNMFGVPYEVKIVSAHRTPEMMFSYASSAHERDIQIIIAGAGGAAHLPGKYGSRTHSLACYWCPRACFHALDGLDSLLSIVQMPRGVPVATVAINNATNAGLLAVRMLGIRDADLLARMSQYQEDTRNDVLTKAEKLEKDGWESYLNP
uniref:phosphoribosylaminoimidazole carboxylase n=1 Tax=Fagus sylvatica TaxID=28930 RepID=A0A2N9F680_FAGSY